MRTAIFPGLCASLIFSASASVAGDRGHGEIVERLRAPIIASFSSSKKEYDLEICVADALSTIGWGGPLVLRDGPKDEVMLVGGAGINVYMAAVTFHDVPNGTTLDLRLRGRAWDDRVTTRISKCL